jgi:hypothetical protein
VEEKQDLLAKVGGSMEGWKTRGFFVFCHMQGNQLCCSPSSVLAVQLL